ncbi:TPA: hypothetical protein N0F65_002588 [Lagenidium giganteum]|uniref:Ndc10 domain-containing protein n=1 Tax=Lagenidium giganteum TaxID=4803 RepID=A0AAV2YZS7_9STRA|nr:TPA: hypothetical protein N0F65_002588 [Lagenidium giganteum]
MVFLTSLPREAVRSLAGFMPDRQSYYIERALVEPPTTLQQMVFPFLDSMLAPYENESQPNLASGGFLTLLQMLRIVVL